MSDLMSRASRVALVLAVLAWSTTVFLKAQPTSQLVVSDARPDATASTLTISGETFGPRPFVTLDLVPLRIRETSETQIVAAAPVNLMPPGDYLLTVSRGPTPTDHASLDVTLGGGAFAARVPDQAETTAPDAPPVVTSGVQGEVAATVGDRIITVDEVDREWQRIDPASYIASRQGAYESRRQITDRLVADELLALEAEARGVTTDALLEEEIPKRTVTTPDAAVRSLYQSLGQSVRGTTFAQMEPALRAWLRDVTEPELAKTAYIEELMQLSTPVDVSLVPPRVRIERTDQDAALGPAAAPVEIVAFGDLQNAEYVRFAQQFRRVLATYGDRLRIVFKNLPALDRAAAINAAEALQCAKAQDQFWPYHDLLLEQQGIFDTIRLKQLASEVGLDRTRFDVCLDDGTFRTVVQRGVEEAGRYAVRRSPSFLVNGRFAPAPTPFLSPFEFFLRLIEEELLVQTSAPVAR